MRYCAHCGRPRDAGHYRSCQGCGYTAFTSKDPRLPNSGGKNPGSRAGVSKAGKSKAGVLELGPVPELEVVETEMLMVVRDLCNRRDNLIEQIEAITQNTGVLGPISKPLQDRALDLDKRARVLLYVAEKANLVKLVLAMKQHVTLQPVKARVLLMGAWTPPSHGK